MYQLVCPDGSSASLTDYETCNFGKVPNDIVMTSSMKDDTVVKKYKDFLVQAVRWFGPGGSQLNRVNFTMFDGRATTVNDEEQRNVLFSDATRNLTDVGSRDRYYTWIGEHHCS